MQHAAWWSGDLAALRQQGGAAVAHLAEHLVAAHAINHAEQLRAWRDQVACLSALSVPPGWRLLLEYPLLRLGRRIDAILLSDRAILVLEFKAGADGLNNTNRRQVEDYALDLRDFHAGSRHHPIVPVLIATEAAPRSHPIAWELFWHGVAQVLDTDAAGLSDLLIEIDRRIGRPNVPIDPGAWEQSPYRPVPTIVEAATMLYTRHGVAEIVAARVDVSNLHRTSDAIAECIGAARAGAQHVVVFVTGIPGAGKTLCGLNAVFGASTASAFLTGNLPLVHVLREALARNAHAQGGRSLRVARQEAESAIQPLLGFLRDNVERQEPPHEQVIVFDEAQRAWDGAFGQRRFGLDDSEAGLFLDIMRRHADHAVIVALVGNGQEINTGEAGLGEWGRALAARPDWSVVAAPLVLTGDAPRQRLFVQAPPTMRIDASLHLDVPVRSVRSPLGAPWVDAVLSGDAAQAQALASGGVPFLLTRSLSHMRRALRQMARGERRAGLVCSAGARRLRADGIWPDFPHLDQNAVADWFLNRWPDVRASDALEMPATQFACQGLELDLVGLCWGGDLIRRSGQRAWLARSFVGTHWTIPRNEDRIAYRVNTYRVLLTRARYETIVWVPEGDHADITRDCKTLDTIYNFLLGCGATDLPETFVSDPEPASTLL